MKFLLRHHLTLYRTSVLLKNMCLKRLMECLKHAPLHVFLTRYACHKCNKVFYFERPRRFHYIYNGCRKEDVPAYGRVEQALLLDVLDIAFKTLWLDKEFRSSATGLKIKG